MFPGEIREITKKARSVALSENLRSSVNEEGQNLK